MKEERAIIENVMDTNESEKKEELDEVIPKASKISEDEKRVAEK